MELQKNSWDCFAITLHQSSERYQNFKQNNSHLNIEVFKAVNGRSLSNEDMLQSGLVTNELIKSGLYTQGMAGCDSSHRALWRRVINNKRGALILEDDCITHPQTRKLINGRIKTLMSNDITFFAANTNSILASITPEGLKTVKLFEPEYPTQQWIKTALRNTKVTDIRLEKMLKGFGFCAYFISPQGALKLEQKIFPLSLRATNIPLLTKKMPAISADRAGCGIYTEIEAYIMQPFAAYTPNINSSTQS